MLPATTAMAPRNMAPRPTMVSPIIRQARPMTTIPVPLLMSAVFWAWPTTAPDRPVRALATPQADGDGEIGVDGGGAHHVPVVAGGADAEAQPGAQEGHQQHTRQHGDPPGEEDGVPVAADAGGAEEGE